jgi:hypothetical protein
MTSDPDPLELAIFLVPGQNPATPERLPGHTMDYPRRASLVQFRWVIAGIAVLAIAAYALLLTGALSVG